MPDTLLVGCDMELGLEDLGLAGAAFVAIGHIHKGQDWTWNDVPIVYPGSPRRTAFGELESKGYVIATFDGAALVSWERVPTPATPMLLFEGAWRDGQAQVTSKAYPHADTTRGAEVRLRYEVAGDERDAARRAFGELRERLLTDGALVVKLEEEVRATTRARAPEIAEAVGLPAQLRAFWAARNVPLTEDRAARVLALLSTIDNEAA